VDGVREELLKSGVEPVAAGRILDMVGLQGAPGDVLEELSERLAGDERAQTALENLRAIIGYLEQLGVPPAAYAIAPRLARGLSYYTGAVFESVIETPPMGSLLGGGRYDELIGMFAGRPIPTVGLAFGLERLFDLMTELGLGTQMRTVSEVFVTLFSDDLAGASLTLARDLRAAGLKVETALDPSDKLGKQFKYADRKGIPFALVLGPDELARDEVVVKDLRSGEQRAVAREVVVGLLRGTSD
jgi:histidyl-tRNA synthetase